VVCAAAGGAPLALHTARVAQASDRHDRACVCPWMREGRLRTCAACPPRGSLLAQRLRTAQPATAVRSATSPASALALRADNAAAGALRSPGGARSTPRVPRCTRAVRPLGTTTTTLFASTDIWINPVRAHDAPRRPTPPTAEVRCVAATPPTDTAMHSCRLPFLARQQRGGGQQRRHPTGRERMGSADPAHFKNLSWFNALTNPGSPRFTLQVHRARASPASRPSRPQHGHQCRRVLVRALFGFGKKESGEDKDSGDLVTNMVSKLFPTAMDDMNPSGLQRMTVEEVRLGFFAPLMFLTRRLQLAAAAAGA
jgi:hypothetical protein